MKCSKPGKPFTAPQKAAILRLYVQQRLRTTETARRLQFSVDPVAQFLRERGVLRRRGNPGVPKKLSVAARRTLESELPTTTDADLGRKYGLTRERVRQIRKELGYPPSPALRSARAVRAQAERREQKERARELREQQYWAKPLPDVDRLSEHWRSGATMSELARQYGLTCAIIHNHVSWLRSRFPDKFPRRRLRRVLKTDS